MKRIAKLNILHLKRILLLWFLILVSASSFSQRESREVKKKKNEALNLEEQQRKDYVKSRDKAVKHRFEMQDKETQERMKESRKTAKKNNKTKKPFILFRPFKKRKAKKRW